MDKIEDIAGFPITTLSGSDCISILVAWVKGGGRGRYAVCANPHSLEIARTDAAFDAAIRNADLVVPDGVGVVIASKILGGSIRERITGMDIFLGLSEVLNREKGCRYFFLGSSEENLVKLREKMRRDFPDIIVAGTYAPPFRGDFSEADDLQMLDAINRAGTDVLWVGMTAPKQEKWIYRNRDRINVKFIGAIGAVFDFYSGNVKRSHPAFQKLGLEWLPRLIREPRRLWYRNFVSNPSFLLRVIRCRLTGRCKTKDPK